MRCLFFGVCVVAGMTSLSLADEAAAPVEPPDEGAGVSASVASGTDSATSPGTIVLAHPDPVPLDTSAHLAPVRPADLTRDAVDAGALKNIRLLWSKNGSARVLLGTGERTVGAGDAIGSDTVKRVEPRRIILTRPPGPDETGEAKIIVEFDRGGRGHVEVYRQKRETPPPDGLR